ncbi:MAG: helicase-related protein [Acidobacteria bacterium]|nr:helicase-related protein [Acidobacteriota bacterium]
MQATVSMIAIDEAHKIFDRMPTYRPAFDEMQQLKELSCPIVAMSATLTSSQIDVLKQKYVRSDKCLVLTKGVHRDNLHLCLQRYRRCKLVHVEQLLDDEDESDKENAPECDPTTSTSMWVDSINKIESLFKDHSTVLYLDFARDVEEITDILRQKNIKAGRYTGQISVGDQKQADKMFQQGETSVLVATDSYELGVDNPNVNQVIRIGCPRNLGVFLQEVGRAGRKPDCTAQGMLLFNEYIDDKRLGQWLKAALDSSAKDPKVEAVKSEILFTYTQAWRFIYSIYNGKCLLQALACFYGGAGDSDPPTCFIANNPLCSVCELAEEICQVSIDIKEYLVLLLRAIQELYETGLQGVTKTLLISVLLQTNEKYVRTFGTLQSIFDNEESCWGCGVSVNGTKMSQPGWHKVLYVAVHLSLVDLDFTFRPFENHYEVHRKYLLSSSGTEFLQDPQAVMSVDPHACVVEKLLGVIHRNSKRCNQSRGKQLKPRIVNAVEGCHMEGSNEALKFIGFGCETDTCIYFDNCFLLQNASKDPHFLLNYIQLTRTQAATKEISYFGWCSNNSFV